MTDSNSDRTDVHFPKIFKAYEFQFLGLSPEIEKKYCKIVTDLGGKVSNQSGYALTTRDHVLKLIKSTKNNNNLLNVTRMYKILYLLHSIEARRPLPIDLYRFESVKKQAEEKTNRQSFQQLLQEEQQEKFTQKPHKRLKIDSSSSSEEEELLQEEQQEKFTKKSHKRLRIESSSSSEEDIIPSLNNSPIESKIELTCNGTANDHSINVESISESLESEARLRHNTIAKTISESSDDCIENNSSDDDDSLIENRSKWWISQDIPEKARCKQVLCTFSPEIHRSHGRPQYTMTMFEQRIMIAFIIKFNVIDKIKGAKIYKDMGKFGYLTHRTYETLRNNMRRSIMPKINTFGLPENILKQFEDFR
ncbi:uncharacterized protein LOC106657602 [Trichogramma pretiosum]|uniref:uncharacterized protein LOC106657602 n=1 Tax=Trichogramma pretiosum TaxID=7493 RepID=UPI000C71977B|nr:uncharacterized protein LOC106657602 [Trichogramma pretiosum]